MSHSLDYEDLMEGTPSISLISIKVRLVGPFSKLFRYYMGAILVIVVKVVREVFSNRGVHI